jgi:hypothetical protein
MFPSYIKEWRLLGSLPSLSQIELASARKKRKRRHVLKCRGSKQRTGSRELFRAIWWMNMCLFLLLDSQQQYQTTWYFNYFTSDRGWHITLKTDTVFTKHPYDSNPFYFWLEGKTEDWPSSSRSLLQARHGRKKTLHELSKFTRQLQPTTTFQDSYPKPLQKTQIQDPRVGSR